MVVMPCHTVNKVLNAFGSLLRYFDDIGYSYTDWSAQCRFKSNTLQIGSGQVQVLPLRKL